MFCIDDGKYQNKKMSIEWKHIPRRASLHSIYTYQDGSAFIENIIKSICFAENITNFQWILFDIMLLRFIVNDIGVVQKPGTKLATRH